MFFFLIRGIFFFNVVMISLLFASTSQNFFLYFSVFFSYQDLFQPLCFYLQIFTLLIKSCF